MTSLTISVPEDVKHFVEEQAIRNGYSSTGDYLLSLIEQAQLSSEQEAVEAKLVGQLL